MFNSGEIVAPFTSDQSSFMKALGKYVPLGDGFGEFHDGFHNIHGIPNDQFSLIVTMPPSYIITAAAYAQSYTNIYITDRIIRDRNR